MKIGKYTLRKPWTHEVEIDLGAELYAAVRKSIGEDIAQEIQALHPNMSWTYDCDMVLVIQKCVDIARGQK